MLIHQYFHIKPFCAEFRLQGSNTNLISWKCLPFFCALGKSVWFQYFFSKRSWKRPYIVISSWIGWCLQWTLFHEHGFTLTHWGRDKMAAIFQMAFSNAFCWMNMYKFQLRFHWSLFTRVPLTIYQHWLRQWLGADQVTSHCLKQWWLFYWRIYASLGLNELIPVITCPVKCRMKLLLHS